MATLAFPGSPTHSHRGPALPAVTGLLGLFLGTGKLSKQKEASFKKNWSADAPRKQRHPIHCGRECSLQVCAPIQSKQHRHSVLIVCG
jgi:hypothetical protein